MSTGRKAAAVATFTSKGMRPSQEDYVLIDREKSIFVVADGFGGPVPGSEASKLACESVRNFLFKEAGDLEATLPFELRSYFSLAGNVLFNSLIHANRKLMASNKGKNVNERGGASILAAFLDGELLALANVGVCSAKLIRGKNSVDLVTPRSYGLLRDAFSHRTHEEWKVPLIALGMSDSLEPEIYEYRVQKGDWILLATDGVDENTLNQIQQIKLTKLTPEESSEKILKIMNDTQFKDNASISLVLL